MSEQNTALWERRLGDVLNALIDDDADVPAPTVTVADLIAAGREIRRRRRRRHTVFALSAVLVVIAALSFGAVLAVAHQDSVVPPAYGIPSGVMSSDPASPTIAFGWLPTDLRGEYQVEQEAVGTSLTPNLNASSALSADTAAGASGVQIWNLMNTYLYAFVGSGPGFQHGTPAGTVSGHQAWWSVAPGSAQAATAGRLILTWQYKPNAWAVIDYTSPSTDAPTGAMVLKVANGLVIGPAHAYALPFRIPKVPASLHPDGVLLSLDQKQNAQNGNAALRFCVISPCAEDGLIVSQLAMTGVRQSLLYWSNAPQIDPFTGKFRPDTDKPTSQNATVDNMPAELWTTTNSATLLFTVGTSSEMVSATGAEYKAIGGKSGLIAFARSLTWLGTDPSRWTTNVLG